METEEVAELRESLEGLEAAVGKLSAALGSTESELAGYRGRLRQCSVEGRLRQDGEAWEPDLCTNCTCSHGQVSPERPMVTFEDMGLIVRSGAGNKAARFSPAPSPTSACHSSAAPSAHLTPDLCYT